MEKLKNKKIIVASIVTATLILFATWAVFQVVEYNKHYFPMQHYEVSCLTNAVYKLSDKGTEEQRKDIIADIMQKRGNNQFESNVVDVLESHPDIYGQWGEDDIKKPKDVNTEKYEKAQASVEKFIVDKRIPVIGVPEIK